VLLVGMGNPKQEQWIDAHRARLNVPLCLAIGGLFDYWVGDLIRAPGWIRRMGYEWLHILVSQPHKARRYLIGNPKFLLRVARSRLLPSDMRKRP
jgi:N-acetylglucosaminyldiphosphoundecaprenol N-acetyl-beta-D-mannosaminyltransferase